LRSFIAILLASIFLFQSASKLLIIANYEVNKVSITQKYCVNKTKPKMHCNGKCHMMKRMKEEEKKENQAPTSQKEKLEVQFFSTKSFNFIASTVLKKEAIQVSYLFSKSNKHLLGVFHPPQALWSS